MNAKRPIVFLSVLVVALAMFATMPVAAHNVNGGCSVSQANVAQVSGNLAFDDVIDDDIEQDNDATNVEQFSSQFVNADQNVEDNDLSTVVAAQSVSQSNSQRACNTHG